MTIKYSQNTASQDQIIEHLEQSSKYFNPPLDSYVSIPNYGKKIFENAITFEAWDGNILVGLAAVYFNDYSSKIGFWTNLSLLREYQKRGIASELTRQLINYAQLNEFLKINLEVKMINKNVYCFHKNQGFEKTGQNNDCFIMTYNIKPFVK